MHHKVGWTSLCGFVFVAMFAGPLLADTVDPAEITQTRIAGFREIGTAFKAIHDTLQETTPQTVLLQESAKQIVKSSREMYYWFPAGSGPETGLKTHAKAEIWSNPADFKKAQDGLAAEAQAFQNVVTGGNIDLIRAETTKLGQTCQSCHQQFRARID